MYVSKSFILDQLPAYENKWVTVMQRQAVPNIMRAMYSAQKQYRGYYDRIGLYFEGATLADTCENLYNFCKDNIHYKEESEHWQTTALPTGILVRGEGDCKHYALFIAGCLAAIERAEGTPINWEFCFASYDWARPTPYHVFVIVTEDDGNQIWVDPTPGAYGKEPVWMVTRKV